VTVVFEKRLSRARAVHQLRFSGLVLIQLALI